jgi:SPP1 gp7 family putative phage head morphogenesis protein
MPESTVAMMVRRQKEALLLHEADELRLLARRWLEVEKALEAEMLKIALELSKEGVLTEAMILQNRRFQSLLYKARAEYAKFADDFEAIAEQMQDYGLTKGVSDAVKVLHLSIDEAGLLIDFEMLNVEAINAMIGLTADGTPLKTLLMKEYGDSVNKMVNALTNGLARGLNPKTVAAEMADGLAGALQKALTIARTEMLRAYRTGTQEQYRSSGVVEQYKRLAVKDDRTCLGCLMQDGETFENADDFSEHPNGRCTLVPVVSGVPAPEWTSGKEWLAGLSEERQREILGDERYDLWQSGAVSLDDLSTLKPNETWGGSFVPTPLQDLTGSG